MSGENGRESGFVGNALQKVVPKPSSGVFRPGFFFFGELGDVPFFHAEFHAEAFAEVLAELRVGIGFLTAEAMVEMRSYDAHFSEFRNREPEERDRIAPAGKRHDETLLPRKAGKEIVRSFADGIGRFFKHGFSISGEVRARDVRSLP